MILNEAVGMVRAFHQHLGATHANAPRLLPCNPKTAATVAATILELGRASSNIGAAQDDLLQTRLGILLEEIAEWLSAHAKGDLIMAADAWGDICYVLLGDAVVAGLPAQEIFAEIHASNMSKEVGQLSGPKKGIKGAQYRPPNIHRILERARKIDEC